MPWEVSPVSELRLALVKRIREGREPLAAVCRRFGVSRKTAYKWLEVHDRQPDRPLVDRSRRPTRCPRKIGDQIEAHILDARDRFGWGARKIHAYLRHQRGLAMPDPRTVHRVLRRNNRLHAPPPEAPPQPFERPAPHDLWQIDYKAGLEVGRRQVYPLTLLDDHSRFLLDLRPLTSHFKAHAWQVLWDAFGAYGLPRQVLSDHEFATTHESPRTLSWFECNLIRLGVEPIHGRVYHPQTQGKVERFHGTLQRECWPRVRRDRLEHFGEDLDTFRDHYNHRRPHEALGDLPPITRLEPSPRRRPDMLPEIAYEKDATLRIVSTVGDIRWRRYRVLAGRGLVGQRVRVEETEHELRLHYGPVLIRALRLDELAHRRML